MNDPAANARRWVVLGVMVCAFLGVDLITPSAFGPNAEYLLAILLGICIAEVNLIAMWAVLAPGNVVVRLPWALLLGALMWYSLVLGNRVHSAHFPRHDAVLLGVILLLGVVVAQIPMWIARASFRWRLVSWPGEAAQARPRPLQFQLRHLLVGTAFLAAALSPARAVLPPGELRTLRLEHQLPVLLVAVTLSNLLVTVPCVWGAFVKSTRLPRVAFLWLVYCAVLTALEFGSLVAILGRPGPRSGEVLLIFYVMNVSQCATVFGALWILRALGFYLVRAPAADASVSEKEGSAEQRQAGGSDPS